MRNNTTILGIAGSLRKDSYNRASLRAAQDLFGKTWGYDAEPDEVRSILPGSVEAGGTCIDTANSSQHGEFETLIGACVAPNRNDFPSLRSTVAVPRCIQRWPCSTATARQRRTRSPIIIILFFESAPSAKTETSDAAG
jgi:hypothetical protein